MGDFDKSSKWLIEHHGNALLWLAGVRDLTAWRTQPAEVVQPSKLPDGLIEAELAGRPAPRLFVVEIGTYPERRMEGQLVEDALLVYAVRKQLPEVVAIVLHPKGRYRVPSSRAVRSAEGYTELHLRWRVIEVWKLSAADLLASGDPGLIPWAPLAQGAEEPETTLRACRTAIDRIPDEAERKNLLAVTQVLARLRYNDPRLLSIFGGRRAMIESPLLDELKAEWQAEARAEARAENIVGFVRERFGSLAKSAEDVVLAERDEARLDRLFRLAARCESVEEFEREVGF